MGYTMKSDLYCRLVRMLLIMVGSILLFPSMLLAQTKKHTDKSHGTLSVSVVNKDTGEAVEQAVVMVMPYGVWGITDTKGSTEIRDIPTGRCTIQVTLLGFVARSDEHVIEPGDANRLTLPLEPLSLAIDDVVVVAQAGKSGESTASVIGRQAIDHIQATSLKDIMQLLPGQVITENPSLTSVGQFYNRTLDKYDNNNAFGAAIMVDGVPLSNNANLNSRGGSFSTVGSGVDLRSIGTDEIESVEIIRGIASAEYGDVSSGTMIVNSKVGVTDFKVRAKIMPGIQQFYAGKGFNLKKGGSLNINADYATGKSDPRYRTDTYDRILLSAIHRITLAGKYTLTTKISSTNTYDWSGPDKDEKVQDVFSRTRENGIAISHAGLLNFDKLFCRTLKYDISYSYKSTDSYTRALIQGRQPLLDAREEGTYPTTMLPLEYRASGGTIGRPTTLFVKISDGFHLDSRDGIFRNRFNIGAEYRTESNSGAGVYNDDPSLPLTQTGTRPRAFYDIPALNQLSAYVEDNIELHLSRSKEYPRLNVQAGLRWTMIQPGRNEQMQSLSPRLNASLHPAEWLGLRFGFGISEKTPSLMMLYPDKSYFDFMNLNYTDAADNYIGVYTTRVFDHTPRNIRSMRSTKLEAGIDITTRHGQRFSIVAFRDKVRNGFSSDNSEWVALVFDRWAASDIVSDSGQLTYDPEHPSSVDTLLHNVTRPGNSDVHISKGIEWDFNLGKIRPTNTSFYLTGAYTQTEYYSSNLVYNRPQGSATTYEKVYVVYTNSSRSTQRRQLTSSLRIVQSIPRLKFVVSGTVQAVLYDYTRSNRALDAPIGYLSPAPGSYVAGRGAAVFTPFTEQEIASPEGVTFGGGHKLSDQILPRSAYSDKAETWPSLWVVNLRVTKDVTRFLGLSFYVNNVFFSQPWHKSSISTSESERNSNLFSYGFEVYLNF